MTPESGRWSGDRLGCDASAGTRQGRNPSPAGSGRYFRVDGASSRSGCGSRSVHRLGISALCLPVRPDKCPPPLDGIWQYGRVRICPTCSRPNGVDLVIRPKQTKKERPRTAPQYLHLSRAPLRSTRNRSFRLLPVLIMAHMPRYRRCHHHGITENPGGKSGASQAC